VVSDGNIVGVVESGFKPLLVDTGALELVSFAEEVEVLPCGGVYIGGPPLELTIELVDFVEDVDGLPSGGVYTGGPPLEVISELSSTEEVAVVFEVEVLTPG
jgi:hypothetical protein